MIDKDVAAGTARLDRECRVYCRYLIGQNASEYVRAKYIEFHTGQCAARTATEDPFDRALLWASRTTPFVAAMADSYASRFCRGSVVRAKLVLTLAIVECSPASHEAIDAVGRGGRMAGMTRIAGYAARYVVTTALAALAFGPIHVLLRLARLAASGDAR